MNIRPCATSWEPELSTFELNCLQGLLTQKPLTGKHLEIGTAAGGTLCKMLQAYTTTACPPFVVIDPMAYFPDQKEVVHANLKEHGFDPSSVDFRVMTSDQAFQKAEATGETFDFILIDGNHKIRSVTHDLRWSRLLNPGGILCLHDFSPRYPGVWHSARRFLKKNPQYTTITHVETLLALRKEKTAKRREVTRIDEAWASLWAPWYQIRPSLEKRLRNWTDPKA